MALRMVTIIHLPAALNPDKFPPIEGPPVQKAIRTSVSPVEMSTQTNVPEYVSKWKNGTQTQVGIINPLEPTMQPFTQSFIC